MEFTFRRHGNVVETREFTLSAKDLRHVAVVWGLNKTEALTSCARQYAQNHDYDAF